jgi:hypothetical protein
MANPVTHEDFAPHVNKLFRFRGRHNVLRLAVVDVTAQPSFPGQQRKPFLLIFHGPRGDVLPEGMYTAEIENGPIIEFHIMPIHTVAPDRQDYQAIFN